jgi:hypothetical protein
MMNEKESNPDGCQVRSWVPYFGAKDDLAKEISKQNWLHGNSNENFFKVY